MQTSAEIRRHIFSLAEGKLFTSREFLSHGKRGTVDQNLDRLVKRGVIVRIAHGVFMRETASGWRPSIQEIAAAKARWSGKEIYACTSYKSNSDGSNRTEQAAVFLCSGGRSTFSYEGQTIRLKTVSNAKSKLMTALPLPPMTAPSKLARRSSRQAMHSLPILDYSTQESTARDSEPISFEPPAAQDTHRSTSTSSMEPGAEFKAPPLFDLALAVVATENQ